MSTLAELKRIADAANTSGTTTVSSSSSRELDESLKQSLSLTIQTQVPAAKLNAQCPYFVIPPWAALPDTATHLEVRREGQPLPSLSLDQYPFYLFGSSNVCDFRLEHPSSSRVHAAVVYHGEKKVFLIVDLQSTNGVTVNGQRLEAKKPTLLPLDGVVRFGLSTRTYTLRRGRPQAPPPPSPPPPQQQAALRDAAAASTTSPPPLPTSLPVAPQSAPLVVPSQSSSDTAASRDCKRDRSETDAEAAATSGAVHPKHLLHLLIKHKDVKRAQSMAPRNKGEVITRTLQAAKELAASVVALHPSVGEGGWNRSTFESAVAEFSECGTAKKGGDLGLVSPGDFGEAFDKGVESLKRPGQVSKPFETELGVHIAYWVEGGKEQQE